MAPGEDVDTRLRLAMFQHLDQVSARHPDGIPSQVINSFTFEGELMRLIVQPGIRKRYKWRGTAGPTRTTGRYAMR